MSLSKFLLVGAAAAYAVYLIFFNNPDKQDDCPSGIPPSHDPAQSRSPQWDERRLRQTINSPQRGHIPAEVSGQSLRATVNRGDLRERCFKLSRIDSPQRDHVPAEVSGQSLRAAVNQEGDLKEQRFKLSRIDTPQRDHVPAEVSGQSLRAMASQEGDLMEQCFGLSKEAYKRGDHALAKQLSEIGERHKHKTERLHALASAAIFQEKNLGRAAGDVDLHGLRVKEAVNYAEKAVKEARWRAEPEVRLIVGQGKHSDGGVARLKPAVQDAIQLLGYRVDVDPRNAGALIVRLGERR